MGSREPKHLSCPTHGAVWGTIYKDGSVDYDCGCHATPTPPAPADDASGERSASIDALRRIARAAKPFSFYTRSLSENPGEYVMRVPKAEADEIQRAVDAIWGTDDYTTDDAGGAEAWAGGAILAILGVYRDKMPHDAVAALQTLADRLGHPLAPLPARPTNDATVEDARKAFYEAAYAEMDAAAAWERESDKCSGERDDAACRALEEAHFEARGKAAKCYRALRAALRGTRPDGHSPASGQGGV